ncbi:hypothetical protein DPEC_G00000440 [Dallia pectoralis]|uniref:Uncharacterized protein n=1 Tax=Dallia pectoralis TaxID=75939 RepID=A0ACC2HJD7_DALPE|nr:hypothetical protein DPEC_G00000440 [Dallia pectoralis]
MVKIVKQEALLAHRETPETVMAPAGTNGCTEPRPIDILELLSKAKDEYHRAQTSEIEMSFTGDPVMTPEMMKTASETTDVALSTPQPEKTAHSGQRQITVEELFGSSLPRESGLLPAMPTQTSIEPGSPGPNSYLQAQSYTPVVPFKPLLAPCLATDPLGNNRHPVMETRGNHGYTQELSPMFPSGPPQDPRSQQPGSSLLVVLSGAETGSPSTYLGQDLLGCLKPSPSDLHKPTLAPCFLTSPLATPQSFREPIPKPAGHCNVPTAPVQLKNKEQDMFSQSNKLSKPMLTGLGVLGAGPSLTGAGPSLTGAGPSLTEAGPSLTEAGPSLTGAELSVLLSPSAFQQSVVKVTSPPRQVAPPSPTSTAPPPCNRTQLQDTLVHLIKNDPVFLSAIHEAYLQSLSKDLGNIKL